MVSPRLISRNLLGTWRNRIRSSTLPQIFTYREMVIGTVLSRPVRTLARMAPSLLHRHGSLANPTDWLDCSDRQVIL